MVIIDGAIVCIILIGFRIHEKNCLNNSFVITSKTKFKGRVGYHGHQEDIEKD
jgi:hypothetical protein